ncbi:T9SS type A sorting domain-containing protein [Flavobacterium sp. UBA4197]|uniref:T9SS type A sorting domain-containing protein n=1 Tax=Flavobacterium sp. UBA4197 TaxID=1946546 RepID=UPI00257C7C1B|nr:T9SS type A sorting domain-containing protein [Flavobacterium sp. UBA4197]
MKNNIKNQKVCFLLLVIFISNLTYAQCWQSISEGHGHTAAIKTDGTLWTWGWNQGGQLGNGTNSNSNVPISLSCGALSNKEVAFQNDLTIYPNPVNNILNIESQSTIFSIEIIDIKGRVILKSKENSNRASYQKEFQIIFWSQQKKGRLCTVL